MRATRLLARLPTTAARLAVKVVPMFSPRTMAKACSKLMTPETRAAKVNAVAAEEDWIKAVSPAPNNKNKTLLPSPSPRLGRKVAKSSWAPSTAIWSFNRSKPMNSKAKPKTMSAICLGTRRSSNNSGTASPASGSAKSLSENPPKDNTINQAVIVVPTLVPSSTPTDSRMVSNPAFTKLTNVTVTAELD